MLPSTLSSDTSPQAEQLQIELLHRAQVWRKLELLDDLNSTVRALAMCGLRRRHYHGPGPELRRFLADIVLGSELASRAYGSSVPPDGGEGDGPVAESAIAVTLLVVEQLEALGVPYLLGGSLASSAHGVPRSTMDADLVADVRLEHVDTLVRALAPAFYIDGDAMRDAVQQRSSFNVIHLASMFKVDVFLPRRRPFDASQLDRRAREVVVADPERAVFVASPEDTVLAKLEWYRSGGEVSERQWTDVVGILKVQGAGIDQAYLQRWAADLGVSDLLERALLDAGAL